ncbi:MAG TPA: hypothetical protein ENH55_16680 [Aurantimonas coralicida]|uniref:Uncharacterized protein n=2 Tax=root TaxID=1 RepID=A0A9C9THB2_9HYPH|nr:hypothetical protein [Aurantimonas coralicida]HEU00541.1 hypothetical protein [Aurantimonas coralicida]
MGEPGLAELHAGLAALKAAIETELKGVNARIGKMEKTQACLVEQMTAGRTTVRVLRWVGATVLALAGLAAAFWERIGG